MEEPVSHSSIRRSLRREGQCDRHAFVGKDTSEWCSGSERKAELSSAVPLPKKISSVFFSDASQNPSRYLHMLCVNWLYVMCIRILILF